jgi:putative aldouronate transport system substrate-binding protein
MAGIAKPNMTASPRITRRKFLAAAGVAAAGGVAAACSRVTPQPVPTADPREETVTLTYLYPSFAGVPADLALVEERLNEMTWVRINARLRLVSLDFGAWDGALSRMNAGGEQYDLCFTAHWTNDYCRNVSSGQFMALDDLLTSRAPGLWASLPETTWNAARVTGRLYAVINQQMFPRLGGFFAKKELAEKHQLDAAAIHAWADLEPALERIKAAERIIPFANSAGLDQAEILGYAPVDDAVGWALVRPGGGLELLNRYELPEVVENWDLIRRWWEKGNVPHAVLGVEEEAARLAAGKAALKCEPVIKPRGEAELCARAGWDVVQRALARPILTTPGVTATMTGVSRATLSAERAVDWLELVNSDKAVYNLLCFGIEGRHWRWRDRAMGVVEPGPEQAGYNPVSDWLFGNQFLAYYRDASAAGAWDDTRRLNEAAAPSPALGFVMDREPVKSEIAAVAALMAGWSPIGKRGKPASELPRLAEEMRKAGGDAVAAEMNKQLQAWKAGT